MALTFDSGVILSTEIRCLSLLGVKGLLHVFSLSAPGDYRGALNFKLTASGFVSVTEEVMNMIKKIQFQIKFEVNLNLMNLLKSSGNWLFILIWVLKIIENKNGFNIKPNIYSRIQKYLWAIIL